MSVRIPGRILSAEALGLVLVVTALQTLTYGITFSLQNTDTKYFFWVCLVAALLSRGLNKTGWNGVQASAAIAALGVLGLWVLGARLASPLLDLGRAVLPVIPQIIQSIYAHTPPDIDTTEMVQAWSVIARASAALQLRLQAWVSGYLTNTIVDDGLVRAMLWTLTLWLTSASMGWFAGRRNAIACMLPSILLLAAITSYSERGTAWVWLMACTLLLLMGIWNYRNHLDQWERRRIDYSESIPYDSGQAVLFLTFAISALALITPSVSWREIRDFLWERERASHNQAAEMLGIQREASGPASPRGSPVQGPALPRQHLLSGGYANSTRIVMTIRTGDLPPAANLPASTDPPRYYWRSTSYDVYAGAGWLTSAASPQTYQTDTPLIPGLLDGYRLLHLDVQMVQPEGRLFWSGILFSADVPMSARWRLRPGSSLFADRSALLQADMFAALSSADSYRAESYIPLATLDELRLASTDYPEAIVERYLRLPPSVPERVHRLAAQITAGQTSAYDKAKAIEAYLHAYPYDLEVPAPPEGMDVADYFLFELKKGYCDYYASAMVVLARSSGLPARFVSGYAPGEYDAPNAQYIVRELHAHSWAEIYFPEIGWVEFEPTASQPEIDRPASRAALPSNRDDDSMASQLLNRFRLEKAIYLLSPLAVMFILSLLYFTLIEYWWLMRLAPGAAIERVYRRLYRMGRPLAGEQTRAETAYEFMHKLIHEIDRVREGSRFSEFLLDAQQDIRSLTELHYNSLFSRMDTQRRDAKFAFNTWKHLRWRLLIAGVTVIARRGVLQRTTKQS